MAPEQIDGFRVTSKDLASATLHLGAAGVPVGDSMGLLENTIGLELDPERRREALRARRRATATIFTGTGAVVLLLAGLYTQVPHSLLGGGCPDLSILPISASTELLLGPIDGSVVDRAGHRPVEDVLGGRAKGHDLLAAARRAGVNGAWQEAWTFPDGDDLVLDTLTFSDESGAAEFGRYDSTHGCPHKIAEHSVDDGRLTVVQANRPDDADGWELILIDGSRVHRVYIVSAQRDVTLERLDEAAGMLGHRSE